MTRKDNGSSTFVENGFDKLTLMGHSHGSGSATIARRASLTRPKWEFLGIRPRTEP